MSLGRAPRLTFHFEIDGDEQRLVVSEKSGVEHRFGCDLGAIKFCNDYLKDALDALKDQIKNKAKLQLRDAAKALEQLHVRGLTIIGLLFSDHRDQSDLTGLLNRAFPSWRNSDVPIVITIAGRPEYLAPLEMLPLFETKSWVEPTNERDLEIAARRFPGFSTIVQRRFTDLPVPQDSDLLLDNDQGLPLKWFSHRSLSSVMQEAKFFKSLNSVKVEGPWPTGKLGAGQFADLLCQFLWQANLPFVDPKRASKVIDQIHYLACHCSFQSEQPLHSILELSDDGDRITIGELIGKITTYTTTASPSAAKPLVFLNACSSARGGSLALPSFPRFFLKNNRNRGFIGTELPIPDREAALFSETFYTSLIEGKTVGQALYLAKMELLKSNNPLGIAYTLYADPDIRVKNAAEPAVGKAGNAKRPGRGIPAKAASL